MWCGGLIRTHIRVKRLIERLPFPQREEVILLIMKKVNESKKAELLSESSLFLFLI